MTRLPGTNTVKHPKFPAKLHPVMRRILALPVNQRIPALEDIKETLEEIVTHYEAQHD